MFKETGNEGQLPSRKKPFGTDKLFPANVGIRIYPILRAQKDFTTGDQGDQPHPGARKPIRPFGNENNRIESGDSKQPHFSPRELFSSEAKEAQEKGTRYKPPQELVAIWKESLTANKDAMQGFEGDITNAAQSMAAFEEGCNYILDLYGTTEGVTPPSTAILVKDQAEYPPIFHDTESKKTNIKKSFLEKASKIDPTETKTFRDKKRSQNDAELKVTVPELFLLSGIEETHHAVFAQLNPGQDTDTGHKATGTYAEYDALEPEWQALAFKIKYAEEHHMSEETVGMLRSMREAARAVRAQQDLSTEDVDTNLS